LCLKSKALSEVNALDLLMKMTGARVLSENGCKVNAPALYAHHRFYYVCKVDNQASSKMNVPRTGTRNKVLFLVDWYEEFALSYRYKRESQLSLLYGTREQIVRLLVPEQET
jgi:hypothetical protein